MKVSVVIPVYNSERYLAEAIESVLGQTHRDFELILVDDGSTDGSLGIMRDYARMDPRIRVVTQENRGHSGAANRCLAEASCEWVARLDSDDIFLPRKLEMQIAVLKANRKIKVLGTMGNWMDERGRLLVTMEKEGPFDETELEEMVKRNDTIFFNHSSVLMHKKTVLDVGGYRERFVQAEDTDLWNRLAEGKHLLQKMHESLVRCRFHERSSTRSRRKENRLYGEWAVQCIRARRSGLVEPSFEEYMELQRNRPWYTRLDSGRKNSGEDFYQRAALLYANRKYMLTTMNLLASAVIHPVHVIPRVHNRVIRPFLQRLSEHLIARTA